MEYIVSKTKYQLDSLSVRAGDRIFHEREILLNMMRAAYHAKADEYSRYLESLRPEEESKGRPDEISSEVIMPPFMAYSREE